MSFDMEQPSPIARTISPFKDPRPPPCTPAKTARLWDEYERRAVENAKQRDKSKGFKPRPARRDSLRNDSKSIATVRTPALKRPSIDSQSKGSHVALPLTTLAICKSCKQPITYASGICERCKKTIVLSLRSGQTTPPLSPPSRHPVATGIQQLHASLSEMNVPKATSTRRRSFCPLPLQLVDLPLRMSSLQPPPTPTAALDPARERKTSLTDPNEPFLRIQIAPQHVASRSARSASHPTTPTAMSHPPLTPPSTSQSRASTRPPSFVNASHLPPSLSRNNSTAPTDLTNPFASTSATPTSPPSLCRSSYALQNTTSAWDDWDSDNEEEKVGLVGGWMHVGRRSKGKKEKGSMDSTESRDANTAAATTTTTTSTGTGAAGVTKSERTKSNHKPKKSREDQRLEQARTETAEIAKARRTSAQEGRPRRPSGFVRAISCGCRDE